MRGRRPKPTRVREMEGNRGHRPYNRSEASFSPARVEDRPSWLNDIAKAEWNRLAPDMIRLGLLSKADVVAFAAYCLAVSHIVECEARIARAGGVRQVSGSGDAASPGSAAAGDSAADGRTASAGVAAAENVLSFPGPGSKGKRGKRGKRGAAAAGGDGADAGAEAPAMSIDRMIDLCTASDGLTMVDANGVVRKNPYVQTLVQMMDKSRQFAGEFGLTPSARGRIALEDLGVAGLGAGDADRVDGDASEEELIAELEDIKREEEQLVRRLAKAGSAGRAKGAGRKGAKAPRATVH